jgi:hypothetical protein
LPLLSPGAAGASETLSYNYDARGRLVEVDHSGTINDGIATSYTLDNADNRTSMTVSGASQPLASMPLGDRQSAEAERSDVAAISHSSEPAVGR